MWTTKEKPQEHIYDETLELVKCIYGILQSSLFFSKEYINTATLKVAFNK